MSNRYEVRETTVFDRKTGLEWQRQPAGPMPWQKAMDYAKVLSDRDDWHLPTIEKLITLIEFARHNPASSFPGMPAECFWSSSSSADSSGSSRSTYAWLVHFLYGNVSPAAKPSDYYVRCVRGPEVR